jgi:hypothetical protein
VDLKDQDFLYTATSPKVIRPNDEYPVILSLERSKSPVVFEIKITNVEANPDIYDRWGNPPLVKPNVTIHTVAKGTYNECL